MDDDSSAGEDAASPGTESQSSRPALLGILPFRHLPYRRVAGLLLCRNGLDCRGFSRYDAASQTVKPHQIETLRILQS
jgi:hypothetical protein